MPWIIGREDSLKVLELEGPKDVWEEVRREDCLYAGYLLPELCLDRLEDEDFRQRIHLDLRAGWSAIAFTARSQQESVRKALRDYAPPTSPGPRYWAPKGLYLLEKRRFIELLTEIPSESRYEGLDELHQCQLERGDFFCDPILELEMGDLSHRGLQALNQGQSSLAERLLRLGNALF